MYTLPHLAEYINDCLDFNGLRAQTGIFDRLLESLIGLASFQSRLRIDIH